MNTTHPSKLLYFVTNKDDGNLAFHVGDDKTAVIKNHHKLANKHNYTYKKLIHMDQIHSDIVHIVTDEDNFENPPTCDALITDKKDIPLMVMVADCSPIVFYDPKKEVIAVAHSGRAGTFLNISKKVIERFINDFGSKTTDIEVSVGPAIGSCCYEVGEEIVQEAKALKLDFAIIKKESSYYLDIPAILEKQFRESNLTKYTISKECNCCDKDKYYSYRGERQTGRFSAVVMLR